MCIHFIKYFHTLHTPTPCRSLTSGLKALHHQQVKFAWYMYVYDPNLHVHVLGIKAIIIMWGEPSLVGIDVCITQQDFKGSIYWTS